MVGFCHKQAHLFLASVPTLTSTTRVRYLDLGPESGALVQKWTISVTKIDHRSRFGSIGQSALFRWNCTGGIHKPLADVSSSGIQRQFVVHSGLDIIHHSHQMIPVGLSGRSNTAAHVG